MMHELEFNNTDFPDPSQALRHPNGLLAFGGDLSPERLVHAYQKGIFPWYSDGEPIMWWSPDPRAVITSNSLHVSRSMKRFLKSHSYTTCWNRDFSKVIRACAAPRKGAPGTWISPAMIQAYETLHDLGIAHSIEVWDQSELVGGLYGLCLGPFFFGESMFSTRINTSKLALITLVQQLSPFGLELLDCQLMNAHLSRLGAVAIPRSSFLLKLQRSFEVFSNQQATSLDLMPAVRKSVLNLYLNREH